MIVGGGRDYLHIETTAMNSRMRTTHIIREEYSQLSDIEAGCRVQRFELEHLLVGQSHGEVQRSRCILEPVKYYPKAPKSHVPFLYLQPDRPDTNCKHEPR